jgi:hypothetical protein
LINLIILGEVYKLLSVISYAMKKLGA